MKKIIFTLLLLLCATVGVAQEFEQVSDLEGLQRAIDNAKYDNDNKSNAKIKLTADICLNGKSGTLVNTFTGIIDGGNHIIYGGKDENGDMTRKECSYLFHDVENAEIKNLAFHQIRIQDNSNDYLGVIAQRASHSKFGNIVADNISLFCDENYGGTLLGKADECEFLGVMISTCDVTVDGKSAGGVVGKSSKSKYHFCITNVASSVFADGTNWTNDGISGGIVGDSDHDYFNNCANYAMVAADQCCVGGITGQCEYSDFYRCTNNGVVYHSDSSDFEKACKTQREKYKDITLAQVQETLNRVVGDDPSIDGTAIDFNTISAIVYAAASGSSKTFQNTLAFLNDFFGNMENHYDFYNPTGPPTDDVQDGMNMAIVVAVVVLAVTAGYAVASGDDEVGGITGQARGGIFECCSNTGWVACKDDNLGGIVGLGYGVTVNNCLNTGELILDEDDTTGAMVGKVDKDTRNNNKPCKITNCCSTIAIPVIGSYHNSWSGRVDPASGNNYRIQGSNPDTDDWEMKVLSPPMYDGTVAFWLNNGYENRTKGLKPWRMTTGKDYRNHPMPSGANDGVGIDDLQVSHIYNASELVAFAKDVNEKNYQFSNAVLMSDIDMTGNQEFRPIGNRDHAYRGVFDGRGHTIKGINIVTQNNDEGAGLFGTVDAHAYICNVTVDATSSFINYGTGGAAGIVGNVHTQSKKWGTVVIENCGNHADIKAGEHGGGIVGRVWTEEAEHKVIKFIVDKCYSTGNVTAYTGNSALLCGYLKNNGYVSNCWSSGKLLAGNDGVRPYDDEHKEYFVGYWEKADITDCYAVEPTAYVQNAQEYLIQNGVSNVSEADAAMGKFTNLLNQSWGETAWQQNIGTDPYPVRGDKGFYHTRNVSNQYGSVCFPFAVKSDDKIRYYQFVEKTTDGSDIKLMFEYVDEVVPGKAVLYRAAEVKDVASDELPVEICFDGAGDELAIKPIWATYPLPEWEFKGTFEQIVITNTAEAKHAYYISNGEIRNATQTITIAPYRAYFVGPSIKTLQGSGTYQAKTVRFVLKDEDGETAALEMVGDDLVPVQEGGKTYTLFGTEAGSGYRGVVIRGGKKVLHAKLE